MEEKCRKCGSRNVGVRIIIKKGKKYKNYDCVLCGTQRLEPVNEDKYTPPAYEE